MPNSVGYNSVKSGLSIDHDNFTEHQDTNLSPLLRAMPMSFSIPPASRRALVFSMFLVMTSCRAQQIAVMVSSDMLLLVPVLLLLLPPGSRWTRSLMAYLPLGCVDEMNRKEKSERRCDNQRPFQRCRFWIQILPWARKALFKCTEPQGCNKCSIGNAKASDIPSSSLTLNVTAKYPFPLGS